VSFHAQIADFATGHAFLPERTDATVPLVERLRGDRLLVVELRPEVAEVTPVRVLRNGLVQNEMTLSMAPPPGGLPDAAWTAALRRRHSLRDVAFLLSPPDLTLRRAVNFAAPPALFGTVLATRPEAIAGPLRPGRTVTAFRDPARPVAIVAEGPANLIERTIEACAGSGLRLVRLQSTWLAALETALWALDNQPAQAIAVVDGPMSVLLRFADDGTWEEPQVMATQALANAAPWPTRIGILRPPDSSTVLPDALEPLGPEWPPVAAFLAFQQ